MSNTTIEVPVFGLVGGEICLDFVNTVSGWRDHAPGEDKLVNYGLLLAWSKQAGLLSEEQADSLSRVAARRPAEANAVLVRAVELRETVYRIFSAAATEQRVRDADLAALNISLSEAMSKAKMRQTEDGFLWDWPPSNVELDRMLWPVARSAAELLTSGHLQRVRECAGDNCGWLFVDTSRNHSRRWCDMNDCGNRAKARRHYHRTKAAGE